eukprot:13973785-Ditylum_brightwellii.AAC.1
MRRNDYHREILTKLKEEDILRVYFHNVNGGLKSGGWGKYEYALKCLKEKEIDIIGFAETNLTWTTQDKYSAKMKLRKEYKGKSKLTTSASDEPSATDYQPGGTLTAVRGNHVERVLEAKIDESGLGWWS